MLRIIFTVLLLALSLVQISCQTNDRNSILIVAVDDLSVADVNCSQDRDVKSGIQILCRESVRFTHAFTPSTLAVPALASLMTGLYPLQHKVRHNGGFLAPELETIPELALRQSYRTSFFSGGAPVFRRSGLNQGFELFEDNITPTFTSLFRSFKRNSEMFMQWLDQDVGRNAYFSVIYAPDLLFTTTETSTYLGEARNLSYESQFEEFDETLADLINNLKELNRWEKTTVILVGLSGHPSSNRSNEIVPLNVHSENSQVALLIKPSQEKKRDEAIYWKVDRNVTLTDVGRTLYDLLGASTTEGSPQDFPSYSLREFLKSSSGELPEDRPIVIESGWGLWRQASPLRFGVVSNFALYINDQKPLLYNTLIDRFEVNPLPLLQQSLLPYTKRAQSLIDKNRLPVFNGVSSEWVAKLSIPFSRWMRADQEALLLADLKKLSQKNPKSLDLLNWTAQISLNQRDWETLKNLGTKNSISTWQYVAEKNLNVKNTKTQDPCFTLLTEKTIHASHLKNCSDPLFLELIDWVRADDRGLSKEAQKKRFERSFRNYMLEQQIQRTNIAANLVWDTSRDNIYAPSRTELALNLPEYARLRTQVYKSLSAPFED
ncbi:Sulfatase [compost metagenome]